jgi:uncharacterized protein YjbI with pentapeptide repeats
MALTKMADDEFLQRYAAGEQDFFRAELTDTDLSRAIGWEKNNPVGQTLTGAVLVEGDFSGTNFCANDMRACNFSRSNMSRCQFTLANLTRTRFKSRSCSFLVIQL